MQWRQADAINFTDSLRLKNINWLQLAFNYNAIKLALNNVPFKIIIAYSVCTTAIYFPDVLSYLIISMFSTSWRVSNFWEYKGDVEKCKWKAEEFYVCFITKRRKLKKFILHRTWKLLLTKKFMAAKFRSGLNGRWKTTLKTFLVESLRFFISELTFSFVVFCEKSGWTMLY